MFGKSHFMIGLSLGSIIGALCCRLAHTQKAEELKNEVYHAILRMEEQAKEKMHSIANEHFKK